MSKAIIETHADGLGDHILYTTLPFMFHSFTNDDVYISNRIGFRNDGIRALLWAPNPFIKGFSGEEPTFSGRDRVVGRELIRIMKHYDSPIEAIHKLAGFSDEQIRVGPKLPSIHYLPKMIPELKDVVLMDPTSISQGFPATNFEEFAKWVCRWLDEDLTQAAIVANAAQTGSGADTLPHLRRWNTMTIFDYVDAIYSCKLFLGVDSGSNSLASAVIGKDERLKGKAYVLTTTQSFNDKIFIYPNIRYMVTGKLTPDFHPYW